VIPNHVSVDKEKSERGRNRRIETDRQTDKKLLQRLQCVYLPDGGGGGGG
jgi:hypothetical protein